MIKSTKRFILHTDGLNSQGFRMLTDGADLTDFMKNPLLLFNHIRPTGNDKNQILPLGYWEDIKIENGEISGVPVFDDKDEFAKTIYNKVESGVIKMCSPGATALETSRDKKDLLPGQKLETVTQWLLKEGSLCDIGANPDALAVALYDSDSNMIALTESGIPILPTTIKTNMKTEKKAAASADKKDVKLADETKPVDTAAAEAELADDAAPDPKDAEIADLKAKLADALAKLEAATVGKELAADSPEAELADDSTEPTKEMKLAHAAHKMGKIRLNEVEGTIQLAKVDYPGTVAMLKKKKAEPTLKSQIEMQGAGEENRVIKLSEKGWDELFKSSGDLEFLKLHAPDVYKAKYKTKFGKEPKNL